MKTEYTNTEIAAARAELEAESRDMMIEGLLADVQAVIPNAAGAFREIFDALVCERAARIRERSKRSSVDPLAIALVRQTLQVIQAEWMKLSPEEINRLIEPALAALANEDEPPKAIHKYHEGPCALTVLECFMSPEEAWNVALEHTCFPCSCDDASKQAVEFLANKFRTLTMTIIDERPYDTGGDTCITMSRGEGPQIEIVSRIDVDLWLQRLRDDAAHLADKDDMAATSCRLETAAGMLTTWVNGYARRKIAEITPSSAESADDEDEDNDDGDGDGEDDGEDDQTGVPLGYRIGQWGRWHGSGVFDPQWIPTGTWDASTDDTLSSAREYPGRDEAIAGCLAHRDRVIEGFRHQAEAAARADERSRAEKEISSAMIDRERHLLSRDALSNDDRIELEILRTWRRMIAGSTYAKAITR